MKILLILFVLCSLYTYQITANPGKFKSSGGRSSSSGSRSSSSHSSWSRPASKPSTHTSSSSNVALSYASKPKPSAPEAPRGSHTYPSSHGSSGGSHSYPSSHGTLSGGSHSYPSSHGLSGGSQSYGGSNANRNGAAGTGGYQPYVPSNAAKPAYPASNTGLSGSSGSITSSNVKPNYNAPSGNPSYPSGTGLSGSHATNTQIKPNYNSQPHAYPSGTGLSGNKPSYPAGSGLSGSSQGHISNTNVRPNYNAAPPPYSQNYHPAGSPGGYQPFSHNQPPPPYSPGGYGGYHAPSYGGYGGAHHAPPTYYGGIQSPPNYPVFTPSYQPVYVQKSSSGLGFAGSAVTGVLSGLAAYNLARAFSGSGSSRHVYHHYDNNDPYRNRNEQHSPQSPPPPNVSAKDLSNCTLSVADTKGGVNVIMIPCEIATSFAPDTPKPGNNAPIPVAPVDSTKESCTISVTRNGKNEETTVPCDFLSNLGKNVTVPEPLPPRISCSEVQEGNNLDPNFTPCKFVDILTDEESLKVIPLKKDDSIHSNPVEHGASPTVIPIMGNEETKMATEAILMDLDPVKPSETAPSA